MQALKYEYIVGSETIARSARVAVTASTDEFAIFARRVSATEYVCMGSFEIRAAAVGDYNISLEA